MTFGGEEEGALLLKIPNRTIQQLMYSYLREAYQDAEVFRQGARNTLQSAGRPVLR